MRVGLRRAIIVCALGYFIDVFDIQLFAILRVLSLTELGVSPSRLAIVGGYILNAQMLGMMMGAFLWGLLGDKLGRLKALYGSILVYSIGTLLCSIAYDPVGYGVFRFITGFGLAGETGVAITLIAELMQPQKRVWGIVAIAAFGTLGPAVAVMISMYMEWRTTYVTAGLLGIALFILRMRLVEPRIFTNMATTDTMRGSWKLLIQPQQRLTFLCCVLIGLPLTYCFLLLNFFSLEFSHSILRQGEIFNQKICFICFYVGTSCGTIFCGMLSQWWHNRRRAIATLMLLGILASQLYLMIGPQIKFTAAQFYSIYFVIGLTGGGWSLFVAVAAEHFGTNIRATTATVVSNFIRGLSIPMIFVFQWLREFITITNAAALIGVVFYVTALISLRQLRETHGLDLDYVEK
jgi:MFS transporter, putative metabolite:H+ symporter